MTKQESSGTGIVRIKELKDLGYEAEVAVALDENGAVAFVQFNPLGNVQDVWDGMQMGKIGFVPAQRSDGEVGPTQAAPKGALPPLVFQNGDGPIGGVPRLRTAARPRRRSTLPPIRIGGGSGPVGILPPLRFGGGTGPVGTLPPIRIGGGSGPVGILPPIRIGGGSGPVGSSDPDKPAPVAIALAFSATKARRGKTSRTCQIALRALDQESDSFHTIGTFDAEIFMDQPLLNDGHALSNVRSLDDYRTAIEATADLDLRDRDLLVDQAIVLLSDIYAHLPLKRAMHAIDPVQRLRLLKQRAPEMDVLAFHAELLTIFKELRDLHTNLNLPTPFGPQVAFLGMLVERFYVDGLPRYVVSKVFDNLVVDAEFSDGVEITHWNGLPIDTAVARNADAEAGSNMPSRMARGLETLTLRWLSTSLLPEEDWVSLTYIKDGETRETRLHWLVFDSVSDISTASAPTAALISAMPSPPAFNLGFDERQEVFRQAKKQLFNPRAIDLAQKVAAMGNDLDAVEEMAKDTAFLATTRPDEITARILPSDTGDEYGYIRLWTFLMADGDISAFILEFMRLLSEKMPPNGLIIDVRGNGGGYVIASEFLLQFLTPTQIEPEPAQFVATANALEFVKTVEGMEPWRESLEQAVETGALFSKGLPISPPELVNSVGQIYFGPVVLITDAYCYSACDMFAAGFQDHQIGKVIGIDRRTGAGGANVVTHESLVNDWPAGPFEKLPANAGMRVSLRRTMRVGAQAGDPVEDLGVTPDLYHATTRRDVMDGNKDLIDTAITELAQHPARKCDVSIEDNGAQLVIKLEVLAIDSVELYKNGRHAQTQVVNDDGTVSLVVDMPEDNSLMEVLGFFEDHLVAKREISLELPG